MTAGELYKLYTSISPILNSTSIQSGHGKCLGTLSLNVNKCTSFLAVCLPRNVLGWC